MPKAEKGSAKDIANKMKAKGLQKLKFFCQMCNKQCRDENAINIWKSQSKIMISRGTLAREDLPMLVAYCNAWKQTVCKSGTCTTLKEVTCSKVCKLVGWNYVTHPPSPCYTALCQGSYGAYVCSHVAMML